jgi:hypothetical protein
MELDKNTESELYEMHVYKKGHGLRAYVYRGRILQGNEPTRSSLSVPLSSGTITSMRILPQTVDNAGP